MERYQLIAWFVAGQPFIKRSGKQNNCDTATKFIQEQFQKEPPCFTIKKC
jgi:hypothetical protein